VQCLPDIGFLSEKAREARATGAKSAYGFAV
jgi:hypothetical protein